MKDNTYIAWIMQITNEKNFTEDIVFHAKSDFSLVSIVVIYRLKHKVDEKKKKKEETNYATKL